MTELDKLISLRRNLVSRRRVLVANLQNTAPGQLSGESIARIQSAIEAVDRAIEEERRSSSGSRASAAGATR
jgi:hypothetical protein